MAFNINFDLKWIIIPVAIIIGLSVFNISQCNTNGRIETYNRQLKGDLTAKEVALQEANNELGVSKSELLTQKELADRLAKDKEEVNKEFEKFKKENNLKIKSRDRTIARLKQKTKGGDTEVVVSCEGLEKNCAISYNWTDYFKRFRLTDPNIFKKGNEIFESEQVFKIHGEIFEEEDGSLQVRRLVLREVYKDEDGEYKSIPDAKADIIASDFQYHNPPPSEELNWNWKNLFRLRGIALTSVTAFPDSGLIRFGAGLEWFSFKGFGINNHIAFDFKDAMKIEPRLGISYNPTIFGRELNMAIGVSAGTPFGRMFKEYSVNLDLIFYLNQ